jgi:hypothetical protein
MDYPRILVGIVLVTHMDYPRILVGIVLVFILGSFNYLYILSELISGMFSGIPSGTTSGKSTYFSGS